MRFRNALFNAILFSSIGFACTSKKEDEGNNDNSPGGGGGGGGGNVTPTSDQVVMSGTLAIATELQDGGDVTHVIALNTDTNESHVAEVADDGTFALAIEKDASWVVTYIDETKTGDEMLVSTFGSGELNTIATSETAEAISLGTVDTSTETASTTTTTSELMTAIGLSEEAAETWGEIDDASLRYTNPDIDGDGTVDAIGNQKFPLDFHNRFNVVDATGAAMSMTDLKNAFPPDDADVEFTGSGIIPWFEDSVYDEPLDQYTWTFSVDTVLGSSGGIVCAGMAGGDTLPANTACNMTASDGASGGKKPSLELASAVAGRYTLVAGGKTFVWPNVRVSDFSGGQGFLALFIRMDVSDADKLTGISYRWRIKTAAGAWRAATEEEVKLVVAGGKGYISLKIDGANSGKELGVIVPSSAEGSIVFAEAVYATNGSGEASEDASVNLPSSGVTEAAVKAGLDWDRVLENPGISYDDKLGMRFFMGFTGPN